MSRRPTHRHALFFAGVSFTGGASLVTDPITLGLIAGLVMGQLVGIGECGMVDVPALRKNCSAVALASRAPSVHNTQPWRWRAVTESVRLFADWSRQVPAAARGNSSRDHARALDMSCLDIVQ